MNSKGRRTSLILLSVILFGSAITIIQPYGIGLIFRGLGEQNGEILFNGLIVILILVIAESSIGWVRQYVREILFNVNFWHIPMRLTKAFFLRTLGMLIAEDADIDGGGVESTRDKIWSIQDHFLFTILPGYSLTLFAVIACLYVGPVFGFVALLCCVLDTVFSNSQNRHIQSAVPQIAKEIRRWDRRLRERWNNTPTIKNNGVEIKVENQLTAEIQPTLRKDFVVWAFWYPRQVLFQRTVGGFARVLVIAYVGYETFLQNIQIEEATLVIFSLERIAQELFEIGNARRVIQENLVRIRAYQDALCEKVKFDYREGIAFQGKSNGVEIEMRNVSLSHKIRGIDVPILKSVNLLIEKGERVAIIGPSGAGKSQLTNLILRAFDPSSGEVYVDGIDLRNYALHTYCRYVGHVPQGSEVFEGTIRENVCFGLSEEDQNKVTDENIWAAIKKAGLDFSGRLHDGLNTNIGYKGMRLSGGERQRLTIARAHIKNPKLVVADEATSALDSLSEAHVLEELYGSLEEGTTAIMIAHRLSSLTRCGKIIFVRPLCKCRNGEEQVRTYTSMIELYENDSLFRLMADEQKFTP